MRIQHSNLTITTVKKTLTLISGGFYQQPDNPTGRNQEFTWEELPTYSFKYNQQDATLYNIL
jgi:hypothetical protein